MQTLLQLTDSLPDHLTAETSLSPDYINAVNDARFVKAFGIAVLIFCLLSLLEIRVFNLSIGLGIGLFVLRYGAAPFYRLTGKSIIITGIAPITLIGALPLILFLLVRENRDDKMVQLLASSLFQLPMLIEIGVGIYLILRGQNRLFITLGIAVIAAALLQVTNLPLLILSTAVLGKGIEILSILNNCGNTDDDRQSTQARTLAGVICSGISLGILVVFSLKNLAP